MHDVREFIDWFSFGKQIATLSNNALATTKQIEKQIELIRRLEEKDRNESLQRVLIYYDI